MAPGGNVHSAAPQKPVLPAQSPELAPHWQSPPVVQSVSWVQATPTQSAVVVIAQVPDSQSAFAPHLLFAWQGAAPAPVEQPGGGMHACGGPPPQAPDSQSDPEVHVVPSMARQVPLIQ
jgi:hypothetical protein